MMTVDLTDAYPAPGYQRWVLLINEEATDRDGIPGPFGPLRVIYGEPAIEHPPKPIAPVVGNVPPYPALYILLHGAPH